MVSFQKGPEYHIMSTLFQIKWGCEIPYIPGEMQIRLYQQLVTQENVFLRGNWKQWIIKSTYSLWELE